MGNFNRDNRSGGRRNFGGRSFEKPQMHKVICSSCGKECEVPFKPNGSRPVFCSDCFEKNGGPDSRRSDNRDTNERPNYKDQLVEINTKLDAILKLLAEKNTV